MMSHSDDDIFVREMAGVKPLKNAPKAALKRDQRSVLAQQAARASASQEVIKDNNFLCGGDVELLDAHYPLAFKREGVQHGVYRKLKQGKYQQEARLDLHRMTVEQAREEVFAFIKQSCEYDLRVVVIVHGKGSHNRSQQALLKSYVNKWLPEMCEVQAYCSAQPQHGGVGAVYVQLKKSERKKQENRERLTRGRVEI